MRFDESMMSDMNVSKVNHNSSIVEPSKFSSSPVTAGTILD
jgi:hypothetical protein